MPDRHVVRKDLHPPKLDLTDGPRGTTLPSGKRGITMNNRVLLRIVVTVAVVVPIPVFAQAAAESALTNALSSSATVKGGSALGRALNQSSTQVGTRVQQRTASPVQAGTAKQAPRTRLKNSGTMLTAGSVHSTSSQPMGGISVQGGASNCSLNAAGPQGSPARMTPSADCHGSSSVSKSENDADKYKSFVTLPAPK
jgi:hypothetical protein